MSKLRVMIGAIALGALQGVGSPSPSQEGEGREILAQLQAAEAPLVPADVAAVLFARGPRAVSTLVELVSPAKRPSGSTGEGMVEVTRALDGVPRVGLSLLDSPKLSDGDAVRVASVSLAIMERRGQAAVVPAQLEDLLRGVRARAGAASLGQAVQRVTSRVALDGLLDGAMLLRLVRAGESPLGRDVLEGAARSRMGDAIAECLRRGTGLDGTILNQLHRAVMQGANVRDELIQTSLLPFLTSPREFERSEAARILGKVGRREEVLPLIEALGDPSQLVRLSSLAALQELTGMTIAGDRHRWRLWYADQCAWWQEDGERLVASLGSVPRAKLVGALASVACRRLYRKEISPQLLTMLKNASPDEACAVLAALGSLRDPALAPHVAALGSHPNPDIRSCAAEALRQLR